MEYFDRRAFQRARATDEPIAISAGNVEIEQADQPVITRIAKVVAMHEGNADPLRCRFEHQRA